jgi:hypothetical protein
MLAHLRLHEFVHGDEVSQMGIIPDVHNLCNKYGLSYVIDSYLDNNLFPNKPHWKSMVKSKIDSTQHLLWQNRLILDTQFERFLLLQDTCNAASLIWTAAKIHRYNLHKFAFIARLCCIPPNHNMVICSFCAATTSNIVHHYFIDCLDQSSRRKPS